MRTGSRGRPPRLSVLVLSPALIALACARGTDAPGSPFTVSVSMQFQAGGTATVVSDPPGLSCTQGTCSATFDPSTAVTLTATGGAARFVRWSGDCAGSGSTCSLAGHASVRALFVGANYVFTTSTYHAPVGLTLDAADAQCAARAAAAGLPGTYAAWLSTTTADAASRLGTARGWVRTDGLPFADSVAALTGSNEVRYPPLLDELGVPVSRTEVLTGTSASGGLRSGDNCDDWSNPAAVLLIGEAGEGPGGWTAAAVAACSAGPQYHLYCFGTDSTRPLDVPAAQGRIAFLSGAHAIGGGIAALDAACAADALAAGLPGTFEAFVATSTASAASRFDLGGAPWVRPDGVSVVAAAAHLTDRRLLAPIAVRADGTYAPQWSAWTGATSPLAIGTAETTCSDWTDGSAAGTGSWGLSSATEGPPPDYKTTTGFFSFETTSCGTPELTTCTVTQRCDTLDAFYCLQK